MTDPTPENALQNAQHAASCWLERLGVDAGAVLIVTIAPRPALATWAPGDAATATQVHTDDPAAELLETVGPAATSALGALPEDKRLDALEAVTQGDRLQLLIAPAHGELTLRLARRDGTAHVLASIDADCPLQ
jgi:hypothetical protein